MSEFRRTAFAKGKSVFNSFLGLVIAGGVGVLPGLAVADGPTNEQLEERIRVLERKLEIQSEEAATKAKETPTVAAGEKGFGLKSADGAYEIKFSALAQVDSRFFLNDDGAFRDGFVLRRLRPTIQGSLGKFVAFRFTPEFAGQNGVGDGGAFSAIVDAYFDLKFSPYASLRIGKQKGPLGLERLQSAGNIELIERDYVTELVPNRDLGVALFGEAFKGTVSYTLGGFNGAADGRDVATADDGIKEFEGRVFFEPFKNEYGFFRGLGVGIAGSIGAKDTNTNTNQNATLPRLRTPGQNVFFSYVADDPTKGVVGAVADGEHSRYVPQAYFYHGPTGVLAEYAVSEQKVRRGANQRRIKNDAYSVTASYVLTGEDASYRGVKPAHPFSIGGNGWGALEVVGRYGSLDVDNDVFAGLATEQLANPATSATKANSYGLGVNWILTANAKISADYNHTDFDGGATAAFNGDRRDEKALFTRLTIQY